MAGQVFWVGQDGNIYQTNSSGAVSNMGKAISVGPNGYESTLYSGQATQIVDPVNPPTSGGGGGGGTTTTTRAAAPAPVDLSQYDQAIATANSAVDRLGIDSNVGNANIEQAAADALATLLQGHDQTKATYDQSKASDAKDYVENKNTVSSNVASTLGSALRILSQRGAGGSSAYAESAPGAAARYGTLERTNVGNTFGKNEQALDTGWNNYDNSYNQSVGDIGVQKTNQKNALQASIDTTRAKLMDTLATLTGQRAAAAGGSATASAQPFINQSNSLLDEASRLGQNAPAFQLNAPTYAPPPVSAYTVNPAAVPVTNPSSITDTAGSFLNLLLGKNKTKPLTGAAPA